MASDESLTMRILRSESRIGGDPRDAERDEYVDTPASPEATGGYVAYLADEEAGFLEVSFFDAEDEHRVDDPAIAGR